MLCSHLQPVLELAMRSGKRVESEERFWRKADLVVRLQEPLDMAQVRRELPLPDCVREWWFADAHWGRGGGFTCLLHHHAIAWPPAVLKAGQVAQAIRDVIEGRLTRQALCTLALWWLESDAIVHDPADAAVIDDVVMTLLAMDEGPQFELTDADLAELITQLQG